MKLLVVSQYFYPEQFRINDVCFRLVEMGHDVTVLTGLPNYPMGEIFDGYQWDELQKNKELQGFKDPRTNGFIHMIRGIKVIRCDLAPRKTGKLNLSKNYFSFAYNASKLAIKMSKASGFSDDCYNFDKILVFQYSPVTMGIPAIFLKKRLSRVLGRKVPLIFYCFDLWPESIVSAGLPSQGPIYWAILKLSKWIYKNADQLLISSKQFEKYFNDKLNISANISYLPIYAEELFSDTAKSFSSKENLPLIESDHYLDMNKYNSNFNNGCDKDCIHLLFAGNIGKMQSVQTILLAAAEIQKIRRTEPELAKILFHLVGDGSALEENMELAEKLGLTSIEHPSVIFHGRHPLEDMPAFYTMADAFLVTLKSDPFISYTLPGKVQTYMAAGKPILAAIDGETSDIIEDSQCGLCAPAEDYLTFASNIYKFATQKDNHRKYGDCARAYYENYFSSESFMAKLKFYLK